MVKVIVQQIKMPLEHTMNQVISKVCKKLKIDIKQVLSWKIVKKSFDARNTNSIFVVYSIEVEVKDVKSFKHKNIIVSKKKEYSLPKIKNDLTKAPIIIGSGPAGLFAALILAEAGYKPIVLERGKAVEHRIKDVNIFFETSNLNENSNIQFGEGGAGTFSDGKINTGVKDKFFRKEKVLNEFVLAGAPEEILYSNKPHIGTDYLVEVVKNLRNKIIKLGGEVRFNSLVTDLIIENNQIVGVEVNNKEYIQSNNVVLAIGHSARDTFEMIARKEINIEQKAFAIGLRIEHPQEMINKNQYGSNYNNPLLPVADYKLTYRTKKGRGVYSFCMCPGGFVVNSASEQGHIVCNGMSNFKRNEENANSAIIVNVTPNDFGSEDVLAGMYFQRNWEKKAFEVAGSSYALPIQLLEDFYNNKITTKLGNVKPNIKGSYMFSNLNECLPTYVLEAIKEGLKEFDKKIKGFARKDAILTGVETRSSSPIRITRDDNFESNIKGLYPCGEGAGYAGGIMSAAMDGIKIAEKIIQGN